VRSSKYEFLRLSNPIKFLEIEQSINSDAIIIYTDGSEKDGYSGSGVAIFQNKNVVHEITVPTQTCSNNYAELFAVLPALRWLRNQVVIRGEREVYFFIYSTHNFGTL